MRRQPVLLALLLAAALVGCKQESAGNAPVAARPAASKPAAARAEVARIVFVDQEKGCACTRKRIDTSWKALTAVTGFPPVPDVERIHMDSQADRAAPYTRKRAIMVPPAIYFLDRQGKLVEVLQGEVKAEQVKKVLGAS